jgi:hypothetical protein
MARSTGTDKLVCQHGYFRWADLVLCRLEGCCFGLVVPCQFGDHWLAPDAEKPGRYVVGLEAHAWPSSTAAIAARDAWRQQERQP